MREKLAKLLDNKRFYLACSIIAAVFIWVSLTLSDDSDVVKIIRGVPVQLDYNASTYQSFGLEVIGDEAMTVDITVEGARSTVNGLTAEDFLVYPNVNSVTSAGTKELRLVYSTVNATARYTITDLSQYSVMLRFDTIVTQSFPITADCSGVQVADGYLLSDCLITPDAVTVTGPATEVSAINSAQATLVGMPEGDLSESKIVQGEVGLFNRDGDPVDTSLLTVDVERVEVNVPILRKEVQPLKVQFLNVPQGFDVSTLGYTLDHSSLDVAVPVSYADTLDDYVVGYIDFSSLDYQGSYTFQVELPADYINLDNMQSVTVSFDTGDYVTKQVTVTNVRAINVPAGMNLNVQTSAIYNVTLIGSADSMELLDGLEEQGDLEDYIIAQIDASKITVQRGQQTAAVQIIVPSISDVFATGTYTAVVQIG